MSTLEREQLVPPELTSAEIDAANAARRLINESLDRSRAASITVASEDGSMPAVAVPPAVLRSIARVLELMAKRQPIFLVPQKQELSTVEAANYLNVSRPFVIKEIKAGRLKHRRVGTHRRILYEDLCEYAHSMRAQQQDALERMADNARELGLTY